MRLITFLPPDAHSRPTLGAVVESWAVDLAAARSWAQGARALSTDEMPTTMLGLIHEGPGAWAAAQQVIHALGGEEATSLLGSGRQRVAWDMSEVRLLPPLPRPMSVRDFCAFEEHVAAARAARDLQVPDAWYEFPVFYFSNANAAYGPDEPITIPAYSQALDYELEVACVIGQPGRDIPVERSGAFIFGYMIFNDWSARDVQRKEMEVGLGPAKGKDFASSFGPVIITPDELEEKASDRVGVFDLEMTARVNGEERSRGNWKDLHYSFGEMIARASAEVFLLPGEVLGSGTVGSGSLLELSEGRGPWLQAGDVVELEVERLGVLRNPIRAASGTAPAETTQE